MPFTPSSFEEKPYNRCIDCIHIGRKCDGPDFLAMSIQRLCEWSRLRKAYLNSRDRKWTNGYIAEQADVSKTTVDRFFSGEIDDLKFTTASRILRVLVNGTWGQYPCAMAAGESDGADAAECKRLEDLLESERKKTEYLKEQVRFKESQMLAKDELIADRKRFLLLKDKTIRILAVLLGLCAALILGLLVMDYSNPQAGFFWVR